MALNTDDPKNKPGKKEPLKKKDEQKPAKTNDHEKFSPGEPDDYNAEEFATD